MSSMLRSPKKKKSKTSSAASYYNNPKMVVGDYIYVSRGDDDEGPMLLDPSKAIDHKLGVLYRKQFEDAMEECEKQQEMTMVEMMEEAMASHDKKMAEKKKSAEEDPKLPGKDKENSPVKKKSPVKTKSPAKKPTSKDSTPEKEFDGKDSFLEEFKVPPVPNGDPKPAAEVRCPCEQCSGPPSPSEWPCAGCDEEPCVFDTYRDELEEKVADLRSNGYEWEMHGEARKQLYRYFVRMHHGVLGKGYRVRIPQCVIDFVKHNFPAKDGMYMGHKASQESGDATVDGSPKSVGTEETGTTRESSVYASCGSP